MNSWGTDPEVSIREKALDRPNTSCHFPWDRWKRSVTTIDCAAEDDRKEPLYTDYYYQRKNASLPSFCKLLGPCDYLVHPQTHFMVEKRDFSEVTYCDDLLGQWDGLNRW